MTAAREPDPLVKRLDDLPPMPSSRQLPTSRAELPPARQAEPEPPEEHDLWWGSYAPIALLPSTLFCILLSVVAVWVSRELLPRELTYLSTLGLVGTIWLLQIVRGGYRLFGYDYRLTTRRLYVDRGLLYHETLRLERGQITRVRCVQGLVPRWLGIGTLIVERTELAPPLELEGVAQPNKVARLFTEGQHG